MLAVWHAAEQGHKSRAAPVAIEPVEGKPGRDRRPQPMQRPAFPPTHLVHAKHGGAGHGLREFLIRCGQRLGDIDFQGDQSTERHTQAAEVLEKRLDLAAREPARTGEQLG